MGKLIMRFTAFHTSLPAHQLSPRRTCCVLALLLTITASAQGMRNQQPPEPPPAIAKSRHADRFTLPANNPQYVEKMVARLNMTHRAHDPFGRQQDPDAEPPVVAPSHTPQRVTSLPQKPPLKQIITLLKVTTVNTAENHFLVKDRSSPYKVGDVLSFNYQSNSWKAQVISLNTSRINFRDPDTGETATLDLGPRPPGMSPGSNISQAPGFIRNDTEAPIVLDSP